MLEFQDYNLNFDGVRLPEIQISKKDKIKIGAPENCDNYTYLTYLVNRGFEEKIKNGKIDPKLANVYTERCKYELSVLKKHNIVDYFLLIYDILHWCDESDIPRGIARGSASGSLVFALLNCNRIDPIKHSLPFTRFISEARLQSKIIDGIVWLNGKTLPDYDADVSYYQRDRVIEYIEQKHKGKTCKIATCITLTGKILIKECCKIILGYSEEQSHEISSLVERHYGVVENISDTYINNEEFKKWVDKSEENRKCFNIARQLENGIKSRGQHASGIVISHDLVNNYIPLELSSVNNSMSSYTMDDISNITVKFDALGLKNADINHETCKLLGISLDSIDINDPSIYNYLNNSENYFGLFQIENGVTRKTTLEVKPKNIDELAICLSIGRPATIKDIPKYTKYIKEGILQEIYPSIDECLKLTANILLFQEEVTELCVKVFGFDEISADQIRYCTGKKKKDEMMKWKPIFFEKGKERNIPEKVITQVWDTIESSADYQFSKNHAYSYSYITAINCWLKANHPKEFFLSLLRMAKNEQNPQEVIASIQKELSSFGIKLLPPNITKSELDFSIKPEGIQYGLMAIKGISQKSIEKLNKFRNKQKLNKFQIFHAANEASIPINILSSLIMVGSLDDMLTETRSRTFMEACLWNLLTDKEKRLALDYGAEYNFHLTNLVRDFNEKRKNEKGKPLITDKRRATLKKNFKCYYDLYNFNSKNEDMAAFFSEINLLGYSYSYTLRQIFEPRNYAPLMSIQQVKEEFNGDYVTFVANVKEVKQAKSKEKQTPYLKLKVDDETGETSVLTFETDKHPNMSIHLTDNGRYCQEGDVVVIRGKKRDDCVFAETIKIQRIDMVLKISELEKKLDKKQEIE